MSYFSGCCITLVKLIIFCTMVMMFLQSSMAFNDEERDINPYYEYSSREELVRVAGYGEEKLSTVLVTGSVLCGATSLGSFPVSGALVGIDCGEWSDQSSAASEVTDGYGEFQIELPSQLHAIPNLDKECSVKVLRTPNNSACKPASGREPKKLTLLLALDGVRMYTAGEVKLSIFKERSQ